jgi:hypothetical protein
VTQQPKRLPGESNPVTDADAPTRPVREARSLGIQSLAKGAGLAGGRPFGPGDGGIIKSLIEFLRKRRGGTERTR